MCVLFHSYRIAKLHLLIAVSLIYGLDAFALNSSLTKNIYYETQANGSLTKSDKQVKIYHYEIPLKVLQEDKSLRVPKEIYDSLVFEKGGQKYVRWIIHPEDTEWHTEIKKLLEKNNISAVRHSYYNGYPTASRSWILEDPESGAVFSAKVSTNRLARKEAFKKQTWSDTWETRKALDYIQERNRITPFETFSIFDEPLAVGMPELDQGLIVRTLGASQSDDLIYLPAFSALHETEGKKIALANGFKDPEKFWNKYLNEPVAKAMAEFYAKTGAILDSPHSQNFLIELDKNLKPTGKVILKDLGDINLHIPTVKALGGDELLKIWPSESKVYKASFGVGFLHFNKRPSWLSVAKYRKWGENFFQVFEKELSRRTGVTNFSGEVDLSDHSYHSKPYDSDSDEWKRFRRGLIEDNEKLLASCQKSFVKISAPKLKSSKSLK
jgi:hypothetical protein